MTDLTPDKTQALREFIAVEVCELVRGESDYHWFDKDGFRVLDGTPWDPLTNHEQCHRALDTFEEWEAFKDFDHHVWINPWPDIDEVTWKASDPSFCLAACIAMARARGMEI